MSALSAQSNGIPDHLSGTPITLMGDQPPECGHCGRRLDFDHTSPVSQDADGPIYLGTCSVHGGSLLQDDPEED